MTQFDFVQLSPVKFKKNESCDCPECGEPFFNDPPDFRPCTCKQIMISIPPGQHRHIDCPRHGSVRINGPSFTY